MNSPAQPSSWIVRASALIALIGLFPIALTYGFSIFPNAVGPHFYLRFIATALSILGIITGLLSRSASNKIVPITAAICALIATGVIFQFMWGINDVAANRNGGRMFLVIAAFPLPFFVLNTLLIFKSSMHSDEVKQWQQ
jgi:hypothetical protein